MKTSEVLAAASDILERDGWCKNTMHDIHGRHCAIGAIFQLRNESQCSTWPREYVHAVDELARALPNGQAVPVFNDDVQTTKQDVLNLFHKAIASCEERGE